MEKQHDYVFYVLGLVETPPGGPAKKTKIDMHAGESETSKMLISRPDLVHMDRAARESGADMARLKLRKMSTPESGGMRVSRIIIPEKALRGTKSLASSK